MRVTNPTGLFRDVPAGVASPEGHPKPTAASIGTRANDRGHQWQSFVFTRR
jgi:hypothetical protein